jgi:hypothetical protein
VDDTNKTIFDSKVSLGSLSICVHPHQLSNTYKLGRSCTSQWMLWLLLRMQAEYRWQTHDMGRLPCTGVRL